jgi:hypothetical protein
MHIITRPRPEKITVDFNGKRFEVTMTDDGAFVPNDLGEYMWRRGLVGWDRNTPDPPLQWETHGDAWGDRIDPFAPYVKEIPKSDVDEPEQPEAVAAILGRKGKSRP